MRDHAHREGLERSSNEEIAEAQRRGARRLSLEERFRQNDSMSRLRADALRSAKVRPTSTKPAR